jgi:hypothetical protein
LPPPEAGNGQELACVLTTGEVELGAKPEKSLLPAPAATAMKDPAPDLMNFDNLPRFYSTSTTARLETTARQLGLRIGILYGEGDKCDRYFVVSLRGKRLERMVPLGWTGDEARASLLKLIKEGL